MRGVVLGVVREHAPNSDSVNPIEGQSSPQESRRGGRLFVREHLDVRQAGVIVDRDMNVFPACATSTMLQGTYFIWT